jgi:Protein of unknown function (DUF3054)
MVKRDKTSVERTGLARRARTNPWWVVWDVVTILVFVAIGRAVHDHGVRSAGVASTSWPFLVGLAGAWWLVLRRRWNAGSVKASVTVLTGTIVVGMTLRVIVGQGTAVAFIVVAVVFLGALMVGARVAVVRRRSRPG